MHQQTIQLTKNTKAIVQGTRPIQCRNADHVLHRNNTDSTQFFLGHLGATFINNEDQEKS